MHLVPRPVTHASNSVVGDTTAATRAAVTAATATDATPQLAGEALVVLFAEAEEIARVRDAGHGTLLLRPPFHLGEEDAYLVLPDDIGEEIIDIVRDADHELLAEALRDGLIVLGEVMKNPRGRGLVLDAQQVHEPLSLLTDGAPYAAHVSITGDTDLGDAPRRALPRRVVASTHERESAVRSRAHACVHATPSERRHRCRARAFLRRRRAGSGPSARLPARLNRALTRVSRSV
jgi:hypothetical protein